MICLYTFQILFQKLVYLSEKMVCKDLNTQIEATDKHGVKVGSWARQTGPSLAGCKYCPGATINFSKGKQQLTAHSETKKHRKNFNAKATTVQPTIGEVFESSRDEEKEKLRQATQDLEIGLTQCLSRHNIPPANVDCLVKVLKKYIPDSTIVQKMQLGKNKAGYLIEHGITPIYQNETIKKLKNCDAFGVAMDESEVNKRSELEVLVNVATEEEGLETRHYKTLDLEKGDAETITNTLLEEFVNDGVDFKSKMTSADLDGCNVNQGKDGGI